MLHKLVLTVSLMVFLLTFVSCYPAPTYNPNKQLASGEGFLLPLSRNASPRNVSSGFSSSSFCCQIHAHCCTAVVRKRRSLLDLSLSMTSRRMSKMLKMNKWSRDCYWFYILLKMTSFELEYLESHVLPVAVCWFCWNLTYVRKYLEVYLKASSHLSSNCSLCFILLSQIYDHAKASILKT